MKVDLGGAAQEKKNVKSLQFSYASDVALIGQLGGEETKWENFRWGKKTMDDPDG